MIDPAPSFMLDLFSQDQAYFQSLAQISITYLNKNTTLGDMPMLYCLTGRNVQVSHQLVATCHWPGSAAWQQGLSLATNHAGNKLEAGLTFSAQSSAPIPDSSSKKQKNGQIQRLLFCGNIVLVSTFPLELFLFYRAVGN